MEASRASKQGLLWRDTNGEEGSVLLDMATEKIKICAEGIRCMVYWHNWTGTSECFWDDIKDEVDSEVMKTAGLYSAALPHRSQAVIYVDALIELYNELGLFNKWHTMRSLQSIKKKRDDAYALLLCSSSQEAKDLLMKKKSITSVWRRANAIRKAKVRSRSHHLTTAPPTPL